GLIEVQSARGFEVGPDARSGSNHIVQPDQLPAMRLRRGHRVREGIAQSSDKLEKGQVHIGRRATHEEASTGGSFKQTVEVAEKLPQPLVQEVAGAPPRLVPLFFVMEPRPDRM